MLCLVEEVAQHSTVILISKVQCLLHVKSYILRGWRPCWDVAQRGNIHIFWGGNIYSGVISRCVLIGPTSLSLSACSQLIFPWKKIHHSRLSCLAWFCSSIRGGILGCHVHWHGRWYCPMFGRWVGSTGSLLVPLIPWTSCKLWYFCSRLTHLLQTSWICSFK